MKLLSIKDTAQLTGLAVNTLYSYVCRKKIPHYKIGSRTLFDEDDLDEWLSKKKVEIIQNQGV